MKQNASGFIAEVNRLKKDKRDLAIIFVISLIVIAAMITCLVLALGNNAELKVKNANLEKEKSLLAFAIKKNNANIASLESQLGNLALVNKNLEIENMTLSNQIADTNRFLFPWGNSVTAKLEKTMDFRPLTVLKCDDIACWLLGKAKEFQDFYRGGK